MLNDILKNEYFIALYRTFFSYFFLIIVMRIMGKREVGELNVMDAVVFFIVSELFAISIFETEKSLWHSIVPIFIICTLQITTSFIMLKSNKIRKMVDGKGELVIYNGNIDFTVLKKNRYNLDELMMAVRLKGVDDPKEVAFAVIETSGDISVVKKDDSKLDYPFPIISDGEINAGMLKHLKITEDWLKDELKKNNYNDYANILLCFYKNNSLEIIKKDVK